MHLAQSLLTKARQPIVRTDPLSPPESKVDVPPPTIFIVDDDATMRNSMREFLEEDGWSVEVYSSGDEFLAGYHSHREGCLVVDAMMPRMDGFELLEGLKARGGGPPAIMITGHANIRLAVRAMKAGAVAFLEKPVQYDELVVISSGLWSWREIRLRSRRCARRPRNRLPASPARAASHRNGS